MVKRILVFTAASTTHACENILRLQILLSLFLDQYDYALLVLIFLTFILLGNSDCSMSLTFPLHYFSVHQSLCHLLIWSAMIFVFSLFFFTVRFLKSTSHNLCRLPSATLSHCTESLFTITFLNLSVRQFLIYSVFCLLYWFYIIRVS